MVYAMGSRSRWPWRMSSLLCLHGCFADLVCYFLVRYVGENIGLCVASKRSLCAFKQAAMN